MTGYRGMQRGTPCMGRGLSSVSLREASAVWPARRMFRVCCRGSHSRSMQHFLGSLDGKFRIGGLPYHAGDLCPF